MNGLLLIPVLLPLVMVLFARRLQRHWWLMAAALPSLLLGFFLQEGSSLSIPWVLLGMHFLLDGPGRLFLIFGALIWMLAALFIPRSDLEPDAGGYKKQAFLLAMAGNAMLILAADILTFYVGFALMGLSAYGLIWGRSQRARSAARVYLVFTLVGELALFSALLFLMANSDSLMFSQLAGVPVPSVALALILIGFGIKVALPGLHFWLPRAYLMAPVFGVAVLSGPMMKAGLLGWLRFLPLGSALDEIWGNGLMLLGVLGIALGLLIGLMQREPRSVLAYSSIAKMGLFSALIGFALNNPELADLLVPVMVLLALHHMLVKPMLFMGLDLWQRAVDRYWLVPAMALLALSLSAFPLTGGGMGKSLVSGVLGDHLGWLLLFSGIAGLLLMMRFLWILKQTPRSARYSQRLAMGWMILLPVAVWTPFAWEAVSIELKQVVHLLAGALLIGFYLIVRRWFSLPKWCLHSPGYPFKFRATQVNAQLDRLSEQGRIYLLSVKQALLPVLTSLRTQPVSMTIEPAVWWLLVMVSLLGALSLSL